MADVELSPFSIARYPTTNRQYRDFIDANGYNDPQWWTPLGWTMRVEGGWQTPNYWYDPNWNDDDMPVTGVSWWEAVAFARWAGGSLPTEAQWEYAAKGPLNLTYPWGEDPPTLELANFAPECGASVRRATSIHEHPRNVSPVGCHDMAGNLAEWCLDNVSIPYPAEPPPVDPVHYTAESDEHIVRGGSGLHDDSYLRSTSRDYYPPSLRDNIVGFRIVINGGQRE
jgi:formylglycine-generating enzyme required for sulfatase activity